MGKKFVIHTYEDGSNKPSGKTKAHSTLAGAMAEAKQAAAGIVGGDDSSKKAVLKKGLNPVKSSHEKGVHLPMKAGSGKSKAGIISDMAEGFRKEGNTKKEMTAFGARRDEHKKVARQQRAMPKPNLTKDDPDEEMEQQDPGGGDESGTEQRRPDVSGENNLKAPEAGEEDADTDSGEPNIADGDADPEIRDEETGDGQPPDDALPDDEDPNQTPGEQAVPSEEQEPGLDEEQDPDGALQDDSMSTDGEAPAKDGEVPDDDQLPDVDDEGGEDQPDQGDQQGGMTYIAGDGDNIGQEVGQSVLADDVEALHAVSQKINEGQNMIMDWAEQNGGRVISAGGDEFVLEMPQGCDPQALEELRQQYQQTVGATLTLGCGQSMSEAGKALIAGKLQGKDQVVQYDPSVEDKLFSTHQNPGGDPEAQKQDEHYLGSTYGQGQPDPTQQDQDHGVSPEEADDDTGYFHGADGMQPSSDQGADVDQGVGDQDPDSPIDPEDAIAAVTQGAEQQGSDGDGEMDEAEGDEPGMDEVFDDQVDRASGNNIKGKLAEILQAYRQDQSFIEGAKTQNPDLYRECMTLLQQMIKVARMITPQDQGQGQPPPGDAMPPSGPSPDAPPEDGKAVPNVAAAQGIGSAGGAGGPPPPKKPKPQA